MRIKVCYKCGAQQTDSRFFCVDCNTKLGGAVSKEEAEHHEKKTKAMLEKLYNKSDPLYVSLLDKIIGFASIAGLLTAIVFSVIYRANLPVVGVEMLAVYILFLCTAVNALLPGILWSLEKIRISRYYRNADDIEPSGFYKIGRKLGVYFFFITSVIILVSAIINLVNPPPVFVYNPADFFDFPPEIEAEYWGNYNFD
jgi:hypothetical protein